MARIDLSAMGQDGENLCAFLDMLAYAEGTTLYGGDDGYNVLVGGTLFDSYEHHPRIYVPLTRYKVTSSAAGRYQFLAKTWDALKAKLSLPDFGPVSQDRAAIQLIRERKAYQDVKNGDIRTAISKCRNIWASLPGAGYGQREHKLSDLLAVYSKAGGM
jgi:muramidase (phage lysozyme)